jgi:hypothetical protein
MPDAEVATEVQHHLATALDAMAHASYLEAHLDPSVARAVRAAHRAVAKASNRAARKNRE